MTARDDVTKDSGQLSAQLRNALRLQEISTALIREHEPVGLYEKIVEAASQLMRSDAASMQEYVPERGQLKLLTYRGFHPESAAFWQWVESKSSICCGRALGTGARTIIKDVDACDLLAGTKHLLECRRSGIRAIQSTPLVSRDGRVIGMISTHWRETHEPSEQEFALFDVLVRQAADLVDRAQVHETLRKAKAEAELAKEQAERANQVKSQFFAAASHDLRQPFQAMRLFFEVVTLHGTTGQRPALDKLGQAIQSAENLLNELLDIARLESGAIKCSASDINIADIVNELLSDFQPVASQKSLSLKGRTPSIKVNTDPILLNRILFNLVANALKYTRKGGVLVGVRRRNGRVLVEIWDTGIGIDGLHGDSIFDEFYQIHNQARDRAQGVGLGLSIVRRLCQIIGSEVSFASRVGRGTVFRVAIPCPHPDGIP